MNVQQNIFENIGAEFLLPQYKVSEKLQGIKAFVFDWDGVFNTGEKNNGGSSSFSEVDSMGTNLLRFSFFLQYNKMPLTAVISGEKNEAAFFFCKRERFHASYFKIADKSIALNHFCEEHGIKPHEVCYFFDDVLDLPIARVAGLRIFIPRKATTQFTKYVRQNHMADYITACTSAEFAIRESCEMIMTISGLFDRVITHRMNFDDTYKRYTEARNGTTTGFYTLSNSQVSKVEL
ncbi:MAG TPA: phosphatase [Bacteroidia bacterium]|jgi:3-deoxy-D-manno-octulosonate 8-phosphate phosphatase (KDO 8-P phosphatase)|nr:phosphatase [Bacteroidia bacterium]